VVPIGGRPAEGRLLGGRLHYAQPENGFRSGIEPVLLAAATPAKSGEHVLEAGTGAGAALLCLHARVPDIHSVGVEIDPTIAAIAASNAESNGITTMAVLAAPLQSVALRPDFDHALANPPYHLGGGTPSPRADRDTAKRGSADIMRIWIACLARHLRVRGTLTMIVAAGAVPACLAAMTEARCDCTVVFPLWPVAGRAAKLVLLGGIKGSRTPLTLAPGLILHRQDGSFTPEAQAILRDGAALPLA
jgi:tRNA1Val (adenine37-N6)-methyltransferase